MELKNKDYESAEVGHFEVGVRVGVQLLGTALDFRMNLGVVLERTEVNHMFKTARKVINNSRDRHKEELKNFIFQHSRWQQKLINVS